jgi:tetratricopeptide (TPR) repeat protein
LRGETRMRSRRKGCVNLSLLYYLAIILCLTLFAGCGADTQDEKTVNPENELIKGWQEYNSGNYESAMLSFERVLYVDTSKEMAGDAYNGLGWAYLSVSKNTGLNQMNLTTSIDKFREAINQDKTNSDAWVGQACAFFVRRYTTDDFRNTIEAINNAQQENGKYLYRHDYDSEADLHALKAQCYYYLGDFGSAQSEVENAFTVEKENTVALAVKALLDMVL